MNFVKILVENSKVKESKLFEPSKIASIKPDTGVIIQKPAAFHVIKDCATLAHEYLPLYLFEQYQTPFETLRGKVTKEDLEEFILKSDQNVFYKHLLIIVVEKAKSKSNITTHQHSNVSELYNVSLDSDPYGEYGIESILPNRGFEQKQQNTSYLDVLCKAFEC